MEGEFFQKNGFIAEIHNWAKVWIAYTEYTIPNATIVEEMNTLWECRYESGIQKNGKSPSLDKFTVSVIFRGQILYRYYKGYLQFRFICD